MDALSRETGLFEERLERDVRRTSRLFAGLMAAQWAAGIVFALWVSPRTWAGPLSRPHLHLHAAVFLGGAITSLPVLLALARPAAPLTRHVVAIGQMLTSALLIHLTGGRIETHFHVFGSLAFLAFYRDWRVLVTATVVVAADHALRGVYWPQSVYGVVMIQPLRFLEHAAWVLFEDVFLAWAMLRGLDDMRELARRQAELEEANRDIEAKVRRRTEQLKAAYGRVLAAERRMREAERLSSVGRLAAGVAHEINNPLGIILGFAQSAARRLKPGDALELPVRSIEREARRCKRLVEDLLAFSRQGRARAERFDLHEAVEGTLGIVEAQARVRSVELRRELAPVPGFVGDKNQLQQVVLNLCSNAMDAMPEGGRLSVRTRLEGGRCVLEVEDDGAGIPEEIRARIFDPFFTTKEVGKGTGLGLALVYEIVQKHGGRIDVDSAVGRGTRFTVTIPVGGKS